MKKVDTGKIKKNPFPPGNLIDTTGKLCDMWNYEWEKFSLKKKMKIVLKGKLARYCFE